MYIYLRAYIPFYSCDLDRDQMILIHELDLNILKMYLHIKNAVSRSRFFNS